MIGFEPATPGLFLSCRVPALRRFILLALLIAAAAGLFPQGSQATAAETPAGWVSSLPKALAKAKAERKLVMAYFTGSDWCGYCHMLEEEVFATPDFKDWAHRNVILLYLDFPQTTKLPKEQEDQNNALMHKMGVTALPRIIFFDAEGQALSSVGYIPGGPDRWLDMANMLLPKQTSRQGNLKLAQALAQRQNKPLLVIARLGTPDPVLKAKLDGFYADPWVRRNSGDNLLLCEVDLAGDESTAAEWRTLAERNGAGGRYPAFLLTSSSGDKLLLREGHDIQPALLSRELAAKQPRPQYNGEWLTDLPQALRVARALNRPLLVNFSGSDWCGVCHQLDKEIYKTPVFEDYARRSLVLVNLDFPKMKQLPDDLGLQNKFVAETFGVDQFPYVIVMDNYATPLGALGYTGGTPDSFVSLVKQTIARNGSPLASSGR